MVIGMKKKNKKARTPDDIPQEETFQTEAEKAFEEALKEEENAPRDEAETEEEIAALPKKPLLTASQQKVRKARRTKAAVAAFVLLLGVGVLGNWYYENSDFSANVKPLITSSNKEGTKTLGEAEYVDAATQVQENESEYYSKARLERESAREKALDKLQKIVESTDENDSARAEAGKRIAAISDYISIENKIETLVAAKGVDNCLAVISEDGKRVDVIVDVPELTDAVILQIKDIAMQQLGCSFENVSIIQSKQ